MRSRGGGPEKLYPINRVCLTSDLCAVVTVTKGYEVLESRRLYKTYTELFGEPGGETLTEEQMLYLFRQKPFLMWKVNTSQNKLRTGEDVEIELEVEEYVFDRTGAYAKQLIVRQEDLMFCGTDYGHIPAYQGLRMVVFLQTGDMGICSGDLRWNYFVSEDGRLVPMTEQLRTMEGDYADMTDFGGWQLEDYLNMLRSISDGKEEGEE